MNKLLTRWDHVGCVIARNEDDVCLRNEVKDFKFIPK